MSACVWGPCRYHSSIISHFLGSVITFHTIEYIPTPFSWCYYMPALIIHIGLELWHPCTKGLCRMCCVCVGGGGGSHRHCTTKGATAERLSLCSVPTFDPQNGSFCDLNMPHLPSQKGLGTFLGEFIFCNVLAQNWPFWGHAHLRPKRLQTGPNGTKKGKRA